MSAHLLAENGGLRRIKQGIQLLPSKKGAGHSLLSTSITVQRLLALPISTWFLDKSGATLAINREGVQVCGFGSPQEAMGHSIAVVSEAESARQLIENCHEVTRLGLSRMYEETHVRADGITQQFLSIKSPLYDEQKVLLGVCGFSIVLGRHPLAASLNMLAQLGLLDNTPLSSDSNRLQQLGLPQRERQCLELLLRGFTAKMIARQLDISFRTVEGYLETLKKRLGVTSRVELIALFSEG